MLISQRTAFIAALAIASSIAVPAHAQLVKIDGSSTVFPITEAIAEDFQKSTKGKVKVTVGISGTGGGFKKFCRGETDVSDASRPILKKEMDDCKAAGVQYIELPIAYDALTVVIHPDNKWAQTLTLDELKKMWEPAAQGKVKTWKQVNSAWPDQPIKLFGPGADSGTFDYFTEAVTGKAKSSRGDFTASEDDNVLVQGVSRDINALGYFGFAYYTENRDKLQAVKISNKSGQAVEPSFETVINGKYQPLARPIFIYINAKALDRPEVKEFVEFYMKNAEALVREVKYVPLPAKAYAYNMDHASKKVLGTKFAGENKVGLTIEQLMQLEAKL
ncbi:MAG: PstS family phosphate ABC transporter substrate-binding protein [Burkholderiales bacterium]|jgi:phosphate transport system substrate-binding protein